MRRIFNRNLDSEDLPNIRRRGKKNRPKDKPYLQQKLVGYRPLLTLRVGLVIIAVLEIILVASGCVLFLAVNAAKEHIIDYTNCTQLNNTENTNFFGNPNDGITSELFDTETNGDGKVTCFYKINLTTTFNGTVRFYYGMNNFYQNMRLYFRSRNDEQLQGKKLKNVEDCQPFKEEKNDKGYTVPVAPCGAVANSFFNDTFILKYFNDTEIVNVTWTTKDLIDKNVKTKYQNPPISKSYTLCGAFADTIRPPAWSKDVCMLGNEKEGMGFENFDFMVWMQTAALPEFRKIYRQLNTSQDGFQDGLPPGTYLLSINYNYEVKEFNGNKRFIIAIESIVGTKNYFLPTVYLSTAVALFFVTMFLIAVECCPSLNSRLRQIAKRF
uniref:Cell cycle control protein 50A n=1 Tax=Panagrolaimus sp. PS1159 TaxID=55785 RepID=A0AC35G348_9BILA